MILHPSTPITLVNRTRLLSPLWTFVLCTLMFGPLLVMAVSRYSTPRVLIGSAAFGLMIAWCAVAALRAPYAMTIDGESVRVRRGLRKEKRSPLADVRRWFFSIPDGLPTQAAPTTNALLSLKLADGTRFRAEVTADEAGVIAGWLAGIGTRA